MVQEKIKRGLDKMLIFVDNAAIHMDLEVAELFMANKITMLGFIPSATSKQQPLDKLFFGPIKSKMPGMALELGLPRSYATVARIFERCVEAMERTAQQKGTSVLSSSFRLTGLCPWDPSVHDDASFAPSDLRLGIRKDDQAIRDATARGKRQSGKVLEDVVSAHLPESLAKIKVLADAKRAARLAAAKGTGVAPDGEIDEGGFLKRQLFTSTSFHEAVAAKAAAQEAIERERKEKRLQREAAAAKARIDQAARSAAYQQKLAVSKAERIAANAAKAAKRAAKEARRQTPMPVAVAPKAKKAARRDEDVPNVYAKLYKKAKR